MCMHPCPHPPIYNYVIQHYYTLVPPYLVLFYKGTHFSPYLSFHLEYLPVFLHFAGNPFRLPSKLSLFDTLYIWKVSPKSIIDFIKSSDSPFPIQPNNLSIPICLSVTSHMLLLSICPMNYVPLLNWHQLAETSVQIALSRKHKKTIKHKTKKVT